MNTPTTRLYEVYSVFTHAWVDYCLAATPRDACQQVADRWNAGGRHDGVITADDFTAGVFDPLSPP